MKRIKASEFDKKFDDGEEVLQYCDLSTVRRPNLERKRICANADSAGRILLRDIWPIENVDGYKVHFARSVENVDDDKGHSARRNSKTEPLDEWVRDRSAWQGWQEYYPNRNDFNRTFIFSLMKFYHETDTWLFGGIFRVIALHKDQNCNSGHYYEVKLTPALEAFIGRLKLFSSYRERSTRVNFENHYDGFEVAEILKEPYSGRSFPGYEGINLSFNELESIVKNDRPDWKAALQSVKGIYLITDTLTGKRYVGLADGEAGIWSRWSDYVASGHGGNAGLRELVKEDPDMAYCRANFRFALLEYRSIHTPSKVITDREKFWKEILLSRGKEGLNRN